MSPQEDSDTAGCVGETTQGAVVDKSEYWYPSGIPGIFIMITTTLYLPLILSMTSTY
jgi:hypothetical protein